MLGFGSANFNQGTFGKGVMQGHTDLDATSTVKTFAIAQWESVHSEANSTSWDGQLVDDATWTTQTIS